MLNLLKHLVLFLCVVLGIILSYAIVEYHDTAKLVKSSVKHGHHSSLYIRQFYKIDTAKNADELAYAVRKSIDAFAPADQTFQALSLYTPQARKIRDEYQQGVQALRSNLSEAKQVKNGKDLAKLKKKIKRSEQTLLNSRERLLNLSKRYLLTEQMKMG